MRFLLGGDEDFEREPWRIPDVASRIVFIGGLAAQAGGLY
jgi:hypothetical protein